MSPEQERKVYPKEMKTRRALGIDDPLRGMKAGTDYCESPGVAAIRVLT